MCENASESTMSTRTNYGRKFRSQTSDNMANGQMEKQRWVESEKRKGRRKMKKVR